MGPPRPGWTWSLGGVGHKMSDRHLVVQTIDLKGEGHLLQLVRIELVQSSREEGLLALPVGPTDIIDDSMEGSLGGFILGGQLGRGD